MFAAAATAGDGLGSCSSRSALPCPRAATARRWRRAGPDRLLSAAQDRGGTRLLHRGLDAGSLLLAAMARSSAGMAAASREWNTASAAAARCAGSGDSRRTVPSAASTAPRMLLLTRTGRAPGASAGCPVAADDGAAVGADVELPVGADDEVAGLQRGQDIAGPRVAGGGQRADAALDHRRSWWRRRRTGRAGRMRASTEAAAARPGRCPGPGRG